ncbi:MAG: hypothetical protein Q9209_003370 [Squamulea sp. 1 TL-2023]
MTHKSHLSIPYTSPPLPLRTLDLYLPTTPPSIPSYTIIYIHGGAFRDPLITSQSILPSLPFLFSSKPKSDSLFNGATHIAAIASLNYRLSPYPHHPTHPSAEDNDSRNAKWPDHVADIRAAMRWLLSDSGVERSKYPKLTGNVILIGHSVGATIAFTVALGLGYRDVESEDGFGGLRGKVKAVVGVEGIYDFTALRDAHLEYRGIYEEFTNGAFGKEENGDWEKGNMVAKIGEGGKMEGVEIVVLGHSRCDELVEWGQVKMMEKVLREQGWRGKDELEGGVAREVMVVELRGGHDEICERDVSRPGWRGVRRED